MPQTGSAPPPRPQRGATPCHRAEDAVDPLQRALAAPLTAPVERVAVPPGPDAALRATPNALAPLDELVLERLVKKLAWGGNGQRGTARLELGAGSLAGATLLIRAEGRQVSFELELPAGADAAAWAERIEARLRRRGIELSALDLR